MRISLCAKSVLLHVDGIEFRAIRGSLLEISYGLQDDLLKHVEKNQREEVQKLLDTIKRHDSEIRWDEKTNRFVGRTTIELPVSGLGVISAAMHDTYDVLTEWQELSTRTGVSEAEMQKVMADWDKMVVGIGSPAPSKD